MERDQRAPVRDIFKSTFLANPVSEQRTISIFIILHDRPQRIRRPLLAPAGWGRGLNDRLITHTVDSFFSFLFF